MLTPFHSYSMLSITPTFSGLTSEAVVQSRILNGRNLLATDARSGLWVTMKEVVTEPMFLLLLAACAVYSWLGRVEEAGTLIVALLLVAGISVYQAVRSDRALRALRDLTQPRAQVQRNGSRATVPVEDLVVGDEVLVAEGERIPADGTLHDPNDFAVDEARACYALLRLPGTFKNRPFQLLVVE